MAYLAGVRFPDGIGYGSSGGPQWNNSHVALPGGGTEVSKRWTMPRHSFEVTLPPKSLDDFQEIRNLWMNSSGSVDSFAFKDIQDFTSKAANPEQHTGTPSDTDVQIGVGDGSNKTFQLVKTYTKDGLTFVRTITKPIEDTVVVAIDGTPQASGWSVSDETGIVTFTAAPLNLEVVTAGFEFDVPVRFDPSMDANFLPTMSNFEAISMGPIVLTEDDGDVTTQQRFYAGGGTSQTIEATTEYDFSMGAAVGWDPKAAHSIIMPNPALLAAGFPWGVFHNRTTFGSFTLTFRNYDDSSTLFTMAANNKKILWIEVDSSGDNQWQSLG